MKNIASCGMKAFMWVLGLVSLGLGINYLLLDTSSLIETPAVIVSCTEGYSDDLSSTSYDVSYTYQAEGTEYSGSWNGYSQYSPGDEITVYYDPGSPGTSYTSRGEGTYLGIIGFVFGLLCLGSMGWGVLRSRRAQRDQTAAPVIEPDPGDEVG